jgi:hypothetical protein
MSQHDEHDELIPKVMDRREFAHYKSIGHNITAKQWITGLNPVYDSQAKGAPKK